MINNQQRKTFNKNGTTNFVTSKKKRWHERFVIFDRNQCNVQVNFYNIFHHLGKTIFHTHTQTQWIDQSIKCVHVVGKCITQTMASYDFLMAIIIIIIIDGHGRFKTFIHSFDWMDGHHSFGWWSLLCMPYRSIKKIPIYNTIYNRRTEVWSQCVQITHQ